MLRIEAEINPLESTMLRMLLLIGSSVSRKHGRNERRSWNSTLATPENTPRPWPPSSSPDTNGEVLPVERHHVATLPTEVGGPVVHQLSAPFEQV